MRHRYWMIALIGLLAAGPLAAQTDYAATLDADQAGTTSTASGTAELTLNAAEDSLSYSVTIVGLDLDGLQTPADPDDDVTAMHIHLAPAGSNGPVVFGLISPGHDVDDLVIDPVAGTLTGNWETTDATANPGMTLTDYLGDLEAGNLYFNVHTPAYPPGEIRGQILLVPQPPVIEVPTLGQIGLVLLILVLVGAGIFFLRRPQTA